MAFSDFEDLKAPLFRLFGKLPPQTSKMFLLLPLWREAVGPLASRTEIKAFAAGRLRVEVDPAFFDELRQAQGLVLRRLNGRLAPFHTVDHIEWIPAPSRAQQARRTYVRPRRGCPSHASTR